MESNPRSLLPLKRHLPSVLSFLYQAEPQNVDEGRRDDKVSMEVRVHHGPHRDQCLGSSDPAALGQEEVAHPHLFTNPGPLVPPFDWGNMGTLVRDFGIFGWRVLVLEIG